MAAEVKQVEQNPKEPSVRIVEPDKYKRQKPPPLDVSVGETSMGPKTPTVYTPRDREKKIGHRRVDDTGQVTYKKKPTSELMAAIQLGIGLSIGGLSSKVQRDVLLQDFAVVESVLFPSEGSNLTPAHHYTDFRFKTYAPVAFRYFRELFGIQPDDFLLSLCNDPLRELSNPGASGSIFYISNDDEFIIKTVQHKEAEFLQKLLPGYYMNLNQNPRTLLPKFYGLYCYQCGGKNIRFVVMNNLLPSSIRMHEKYDLKGSTYKRKASKRERAKGSPTLKDLDFMELNPEGIMLEADTYTALMKTMERDCRVLQSFKIMDYSLLGGVYNIDSAQREKEQERRSTSMLESPNETHTAPHITRLMDQSFQNSELSRGRSVKQRLANYSTAMESIQAESEPVELDNEDVPPGGIPARNQKGERLLLYIGIIDILQSYRFKKRLEHAMKAMVHDGDTISVHRPGFYSQRFLEFFSKSVFKKIPSPLKHSPSKKKGVSGRTRSVADEGKYFDKSMDRSRGLGPPEETGATGGRPDLLPASATPPRHLAEGSTEESSTVTRSSEVRVTRTESRSIDSHRPYISVTKSGSNHSGTLDGGDLSAYVSAAIGSPSHSISESTPTHTDYTEGTPSFTASSPSCSSDVLDQTSQATTGKDSGVGAEVGAEVTVEQVELQLVGAAGQGDFLLRSNSQRTSQSVREYTTTLTTTSTAAMSNLEAHRDEVQ